MATPRKNNKTNGSRTQLREEILNGHYLAGTYLPSARELAKSLNVSKSSVHNILKLLQEEGLIQIYPNCGALVLENTVVPDGMVAMGVPAKVREAASPALVEANRKNAEGYVAEAAAHAEANK